MSPFSRVVCSCAVLALSACTKGGGQTGAASPGPAARAGEDPSTPVVRYSGKTLTLREVDAEIAGQLKKMEKDKLELRQQTAEQLVMQTLVREEAAKVGMTEQQFIKANIDDKLPPPSEEEIQRTFEQFKSQMPPNATLETMRNDIVAFLNRDKRRPLMVAMLQDLKKKAGYELLLEEPPVQVEAKGPSRGPEGAKVTIVEFSDFECPFCGKAEEVVTQVMEQYAGKVRLVYRHFPLSFHPHAAKAAEAAACADEQGKFWDMHKALFTDQKKLDVPALKAHAQAVGLDQAKFDSCLDSGRTKAIVDADQQAGAKAGVSGTPAFFINGRLLSGAQPIQEFSRIIDAELARGG